MDLWIRSQDKMNLESVHSINVNHLNKKQIICNYEPDFIGNQGEYYVLLGEYETEERALEVLDEIQNILLPKYLIRFDENKQKIADYMNTGSSYITANCNGDVRNINGTFVYEMPKE